MRTEQYYSAREALDSLTEHLRDMTERKPEGCPFHLALSGGNTAIQMFALWREEYTDRIRWEDVHFYWVDERCVPPTHPESNYGQAKREFLIPLGIPDGHIFRIRGEEPPEAEALRYSDNVMRLLPQRNGLPVFDCIILGAGTDGHTASLFPGDMQALVSGQPYITTVHPQTGQRRISMSGTLLLNHSPILLPLVGTDKKDITDKILGGKGTDPLLPSAYILSRAKDARLYCQTREENIMM